jgi:hypothetical protein
MHAFSDQLLAANDAAYSPKPYFNNCIFKLTLMTNRIFTYNNYLCVIQRVM